MAPQASPEQPTMRLAEILSDLVSLRVCVRRLPPPSLSFPPTSSRLTPFQDSSAALALVTAQSTPTDPSQVQDPPTEQDPDLKRAKDLLRYHYEVKEAHKRGELSRGLDDARRAVERSVDGV